MASPILNNLFASDTKFNNEISCAYTEQQVNRSAADSQGSLYLPQHNIHKQHYLFQLIGAHTLQSSRIFDPKQNEITLGGLSGIGNCKTNNFYGENIFSCDIVPDLKIHHVLHQGFFSFNSGFSFFFPLQPQSILLPQPNPKWQVEKWDIESVTVATAAQGLSYYFFGTEPIRLETSNSTEKIKEKKPAQIIWYSTKDKIPHYLTLPESTKIATTNLGIEGLDSDYDPKTEETTLYVGFENRPGEEFSKDTLIYRYVFKKNPANGRWLDSPFIFQFNELLPRKNPEIPKEAVCYENSEIINGLPKSIFGYSAYQTIGLSDLQFIEKTEDGDFRFLIVSRAGVGFYKAKKESRPPEEISSQFYIQIEEAWFNKKGELIQKTPIKISSDIFKTEEWQPYNIEGVRLFKNKKGELFATLFTDNNLKDFDSAKMNKTSPEALGPATLFIGAKVTEQRE